MARPRGRSVISPGALQTLGYAADAREQRREEIAILASAGAPALQQVHLHEIHRVEVRVAQADGALHGRIEIEQLTRATDLQHLAAGSLVLRAQLGGKWAQLLGRERVVVPCDLQVGPRQHGLDVIEEVAEEEPRSTRLTHPLHAELRDDGRKPRARSIPARQHVARLRPREYPWHRQ